MASDLIERYREKRRKRMADRTETAVNEYKWRRVARMLSRFDADGDEEQQNGKESKGGGGHGNTRLPFGLCMRFGIEIGEGWTPKDAWDALAGKGITADGAYARLKRGEDPGTPDSPEGDAEATPVEATPAEPVEPPKEPKKSIKIGDVDYEDISASHYSWSKNPWRLTARTSDESVSRWARWRGLDFRTKDDMYAFLKEQGVEEFVDPETGEVVNPSEMETLETLMRSEDGHSYFKALSIGLRDGKYTIFGTGLDGKRIREIEAPTLALALEWLRKKGITEDKVKLTPALKKAEAERKAWMTSDKKEWMDINGEKCGNLRLMRSYYGDGWRIEGETEDGTKKRLSFGSRAEALAALKAAGVERVKTSEGYSAGEMNPMEYTPPTAKVTVDGRGYQKIWLDKGYDGKLRLLGTDLDDETRGIYEQPWTMSYNAFEEHLKTRYGLSPEDIDTTDEIRAHIEKMKAEDEARERAIREFEEKAVKIGHSRYINPQITIDSDGDYDLFGYDRDGNRRHLAYASGPADLYETCANFGVEPSVFGMSDEIKEQLRKYDEMRKVFKEKAVTVGGREVMDLKLEHDGGKYYLRGTDERGRRRTAVESRGYQGIAEALEKSGIDPSTVAKTPEAESAYSRYSRAKDALASGKYHRVSSESGDDVFTDLRIEKTGYGYEIHGKDLDGKDHELETVRTMDDAIKSLEEDDISDYKIRDGDKEIPRPSFGMHDVYIRRNRDTGGYTVTASSKRFGDGAVMFEGISEQECRDWLAKNNVNPSSVKTRGMNPNDDVKRTHTAKSLANFDKHRESRVEKLPTISNLTGEEKQQAADMLTDLFSGSAYRMRVPSEYVDDIFDTHFKNLLETGRSGGSDYKPGRRETHQKTFGGSYDVRPIDAEKYGYLGSDDDLTAVEGREGGHYGDVVFKFKKDRVGERTTYTFGDSLDMGRPLAGYAGEHPTIEGMSALKYPDDDASDTVRSILDDYKEYKKGNMSVDDLRAEIRRKMYSSYIECQYHGMMTFEDVDSATFPEHSYNYFVRGLTKEKAEKMLNFFKEHGTKIQYVKDGVLHNGIPLLERKAGVA